MALHRPLLRPLPPAWRNLKLGMPKRIGLMVEPTPFIHVSGYSNRFNEMLKYLNKAGDDVEIVTPDNGPSAPAMAHGFTVNNIPGIKFPLYPLITIGELTPTLAPTPSTRPPR